MSKKITSTILFGRPLGSISWTRTSPRRSRHDDTSALVMGVHSQPPNHHAPRVWDERRQRGRDVVTLTVYSSGSSTQSGLPSPSAGGGSSVPVAAIAGGVAGGAAIAILLVIIWKHWGRVIKRTERIRRKEVQEILTMRENTRRNASSGFRPQSQYRPMFTLNPEGRKVTFLTRSPTLQRAANQNKDVAPSAPAQQAEEKGMNNESAAPRGVFESANETRQGSASLTLTSPPTPALLVRETAPAAEPMRTSESDEQGALEVEVVSTESMLPRRAPSPAPSSSHGTPERAPPPTPSRNTSEPMSPPRPSRSVRMRTPKRLPDPPSIPPGFVGRSSSPTPSHSRTPSVSSSRAQETPRSTSPVPTVPSVPPVPPMPPIPPVAGPSSQPQRQSWVGSPLRNSVLPSDQPVIMPRPKNAQSRPSGESQPVSPTSTWGHEPSLSGSTSQHSAVNGEPRGQYFGSLRRGRASAMNQRTVSTHSSISVYSTDSLGRAEER